jgi:hypothetical protein
MSFAGKSGIIRGNDAPTKPTAIPRIKPEKNGIIKIRKITGIP